MAVLRPQFWTLFAIAAPFTLLVDVALTLFGPEPPKTPAELTPRIAVVIILIPALIGGIAQLAVAHLIARPEDTPRVALAAAFAVLPAYLGAVLLSGIPTGIGLLLLVIPGLYIAARLFLIVPIAVVERLGMIAILKRSWTLTEGHAGSILLFLLLAILFLFGATVLASGVGAALGSVLTLAGLKAVGTFVAALASALVGMILSIAVTAAATVIYLKLR
ncbi:hypothetical protein [Sandarakinorhabdus glacialis]|uniref:hypothetical protein n=1 Tax=Sandarakinorhabdus glacialis TaxID=1614636 RepID=UPI00166BB879|nr:hypothetical protein [Polymorphobacter glacialis]